MGQNISPIFDNKIMGCWRDVPSDWQNTDKTVTFVM